MGRIHGWRTFFRLLVMQRRKKHGAGKQRWLPAIYFAACGQYLVDHQKRTPLRFPIHGTVARWIGNLQLWH